MDSTQKWPLTSHPPHLLIAQREMAILIAPYLEQNADPLGVFLV